MAARTIENVWRAGARWLSIALLLGACGDEPLPTPPSGDDDSDLGEEAPADDDSDDDDDGAQPAKDAGRVDAGASGGKGDAGGKTSPDARAPARPDAAEPDEGEGPDDGDDEEDAGSDSADDDGGETPSEPSGDGGSSSESDASTPAAGMDLGKGDGKDVITIGDSWMSYFLNGGGIERALLAASGQKYRTYAVAGTKLLDGVIPRQYDSAKRADPNIKTVVMTGGGNDILLGGSFVDAQSTIDKVAVRLDELWTQMGKDGVKDVVYIEYSEGGGNGPNVRYGIEKVGPVCKNHKAVRCHFMLSDPIIDKALVDGIHPTQAACTKLGKAAYELMEKEGMRR